MVPALFFCVQGIPSPAAGKTDAAQKYRPKQLPARAVFHKILIKSNENIETIIGRLHGILL